jgi:hypothetical protein
MYSSGSMRAESSEQWRGVRRWLNEHRHELAALATEIYPEIGHVAGTALLCRSEWLPAKPLELQCVNLNWQDHFPGPAVDSAGPATEHVRPLRADGSRYPSYSAALAALAPPSLFENRRIYRILGADLSAPSSCMEFTRGRYFDGVDIGEALAHELAAAWSGEPKASIGRRLSLRRQVGDPCDLARRSVMSAVTTLTIRRDRSGQTSFLLHWRDPAKVTHAGGLYQAVPSGMFQPADDYADAEQNDLDLWRCMVREFSEELLGTSEDYHALGTPIDYEHWAFFRQLNGARHSGKLAVFCVGLGVDPLTLVADILTVAVFDGDSFDSAFRRLIADNAEGRVISGPDGSGVPFTSEAIAKFAYGTEPMQPAGAALLKLAWEHRAQLLGS